MRTSGPAVSTAATQRGGCSAMVQTTVKARARPEKPTTKNQSGVCAATASNGTASTAPIQATAGSTSQFAMHRQRSLNGDACINASNAPQASVSQRHQVAT